MIDQAGSRATKTCIVSAILFSILAIGGQWSAARAESDADYDQIISSLAQKYSVEPALVKAVIRAESAFDPEAVSPRGARGLMQLMPRIARRHGVVDPTDPWQNIRGGVKLLRSLLDRFDDNLRLSLAAYNAGSDAVHRFGGLPPYPETRRYVATVLRFRERYLRQAVNPDPDDEDEKELVRALRSAWPRRAEGIRFGAGIASDGGALRAALHSPEDLLGKEPRQRTDVP